MNKISIVEHALSGARLTIPFTFLGKLGPKHHAIILGANEADDLLWIAELSRKFGYRMIEQWFRDNSKFLSGLVVTQNNGNRDNFEVAVSAAEEIRQRQSAAESQRYHLVFNNCESFAIRHTEGTNKLSPQVAKVLKTAGVVIAAGAVVWQKRKQKSN